ncbi:hypothetical protein J4220_01470 [Candidatus Micrarchaeota archaeon]|nr:hypothetical protein [Candidatus Micrarchaeota archaeon]
MKILSSALFVLAALAVLGSSFASAYSPQSAVIYKNEACGHCSSYISSLYAALESAGVKQIEIKDFLGDAQARSEVASIQQKFGVPFEMQGHLVTLVDGKYLFEGHFPIGVMQKFLSEEAQDYDSLVVTQDSMEKVSSYFHLKDGVIVECPIDQPISECSHNGVQSAGGLDSLKVRVDANAVVLGILGLALLFLVLVYAKVIK